MQAKKFFIFTSGIMPTSFASRQTNNVSVSNNNNNVFAAPVDLLQTAVPRFSEN
jgi:hypothetical protein